MTDWNAPGSGSTGTPTADQSPPGGYGYVGGPQGATGLAPPPEVSGGPERAAITALVKQASHVVLGHPGAIAIAAAAFAAGGHVLFEDSPGVGKTVLAKALARSIGGSFGRVQGTPDLLPSDLTGVSVFDDRVRDWEFRPGPLFNNVVLVDELNRATPRTQSALLEAMAEGQVTVDGTTHPLPEPFFVIATQNPLSGDLGTFPLVGGQRDRFAVSLSLGLPGRAAELDVLEGRGGEQLLAGLAPVAELASWTALRAELGAVYAHPVVLGYALDIVDSIRSQTSSRQPLSTRAALALVALARANAVIAGRSYVAPDDVQAVVVAALAHRIVDVTNDDLPTARSWVAEFVRHVAVPPVPAR